MASIASTATITPSSDPRFTAAVATHSVPTRAEADQDEDHGVSKSVEPRCPALGGSNTGGGVVGSGEHPLLLTQSDDRLGPLDRLDRSTDQPASITRDGAAGSVPRALRDPWDQKTRGNEWYEDRWHRRR